MGRYNSVLESTDFPNTPPGFIVLVLNSRENHSSAGQIYWTKCTSANDEVEDASRKRGRRRRGGIVFYLIYESQAKRGLRYSKRGPGLIHMYDAYNPVWIQFCSRSICLLLAKLVEALFRRASGIREKVFGQHRELA